MKKFELRKLIFFTTFIIILLIGLNTVVLAKTVTVMSYNIRYGRGTDFKVDLDRIIRTIREADADIIGMQEVDKETSRVNGIDSAKYIAEKLGMNYVYGPNIAVGGGEFGNAIISRYPINFFKNYRLSWQTGHEYRGFLLAKIKVEDRNIYFASTHLTHKNAKLRIEQVKDILKITRQLTDPLIIVGDFNARAVTIPIMLMNREYNDAHSLYKMVADYRNLSYEDMFDSKYTFSSTNPNCRIDYIFLSDDLILDTEIEGAFQVLPSEGSDHLPVVAKVKLPVEGTSKIKVDIGIVKSDMMVEWSNKFKLNYEESIENACQFLEKLGYSYTIISQKRLRETDLSQIKLILLPDIRYLTIFEKDKLAYYAMIKGGKILALNQVGVKPNFSDNHELFSEILGIKFMGWNYYRPLHGFIHKVDDHPIWGNIGDYVMMNSHEGMVVATRGSSRILGDWYNDFQAMPSHPDYKNGAIIEGKNSIYIGKNLFEDKSFGNEQVKILLTNCLHYLLKN